MVVALARPPKAKAPSRPPVPKAFPPTQVRPYCSLQRACVLMQGGLFFWPPDLEIENLLLAADGKKKQPHSLTIIGLRLSLCEIFLHLGLKPFDSGHVAIWHGSDASALI
jgi:hypothetical protein